MVVNVDTTNWRYPRSRCKVQSGRLQFGVEFDDIICVGAFQTRL